MKTTANKRNIRNNLTSLSAILFAAAFGVIFGTSQSASALNLRWSYSGTGIEANGTFITENTPDDLGFYLITEITGTRNGKTITGLQPYDTSIPGNEPFLIDNLISLNPVTLTTGGFGYSTIDGNFVNPFFASFLQPSIFLEIFSAPPFIPGFENLGTEDSELPVNFVASPIIVPEPNHTISLLLFSSLSTALGFKRQFFAKKST